jgi:hypothetical protein
MVPDPASMPVSPPQDAFLLRERAGSTLGLGEGGRDQESQSQVAQSFKCSQCTDVETVTAQVRSAEAQLHWFEPEA